MAEPWCGKCDRNKPPQYNENHKTYDGCFECMRNCLRLTPWSSGSARIDKFIREAQEDCHINHPRQFLEWVPSDAFCDIEYVAKGGFGKIYKATWGEGCLWKWEHNELKFKRYGRMCVALKTTFNTTQLSDFLQEIDVHRMIRRESGIARCYGVTKHPVTGDWAMVMYFYDCGDLRSFLKNQTCPSFNDQLGYMRRITRGVHSIHAIGHCHRDLHAGNILNSWVIADLGLSAPISSKSNGKITGVIPYMAPEVLRNGIYSQKSDIFALGVIMWEIFVKHPPFLNVAHDISLAREICHGLRLQIPSIAPHWFAELLTNIWNIDPTRRPDAWEIYICLKEARNILFAQKGHYNESTFAVTEATSLSIESAHPSAIFHSRIHTFHNLSEPSEINSVPQVKSENLQQGATVDLNLVLDI